MWFQISICTPLQRGHGAEWEVLYVAFMEVIIYIIHIAFHGAPGTEARDGGWNTPNTGLPVFTYFRA